MNREFEIVGFDTSDIRDHHFDAIHDLTTAFDAKFACVSILRRIMDMSGSTASFISVTLPMERGSSREVFSSASTGPFFPVVGTAEKAIEVLSGFGWTDLHKPFSRQLPNIESFPNQTFIGYPLFDQLGVLTGSFAVIVGSLTSQQIIEEHCSRLLALLVHRVQEFHFHETIIAQKPQNEALQLSRRGLIFPSLSDFYASSAHSINGQLAVASLQTQILSNPDVTTQTMSQGLTRISKAIAQTGLLLHRQENAFSLLVNQGRGSQLSTSIEMAQASFDLGMSKKVPSILHMDVSSQVIIAVPGNVAYWMFHNVLRMVASVYQWIPGPDRALEIYATTISDSNSADTYTEFRVHMPFNSEILELSRTLFTADHSYFSGQPLANIGSILFGIMSTLNFNWFVDSTDEEIIIKASIPNAVGSEQ